MSGLSKSKPVTLSARVSIIMLRMLSRRTTIHLGRDCQTCVLRAGEGHGRGALLGLRANTVPQRRLSASTDDPRRNSGRVSQQELLIGFLHFSSRFKHVQLYPRRVSNGRKQG